MRIFPKPSAARFRWLRKPINSGIYRHWLVDEGSLTRRLQQRCAKFSVQPRQLQDELPQVDEASLLHIPQRSRALLREVRLHCSGRAVVFAHSILPARSLRGEWRGLRGLGNKPLGGALFADPRVVRTPLEFRKLSSHHALYQRAVAGMQVPPATLWARRSVFSLKCAKILVTEVFLPQVLML